MVFTYTARQDGTVASFEAYRASSRTRDALVATDEKPTSPEAASRQTATPVPAAPQSDGG